MNNINYIAKSLTDNTTKYLDILRINKAQQMMNSASF